MAKEDGKMKETWFEAILYRTEMLTFEQQNRLVAYWNRRLGLKICNVWGENYNKLREKYAKKNKA
jgi:hypothetical protein